MDAAKDAAANIGTAPENAPFLSAIDGSSVTMTHTALEVTLG